MLHFRKSYEVIGYTYEADCHCLDCTRKRFGGEPEAVDYTATDNEGNDIHPIFLGDEFETAPVCGDCLTELE
jgi:predicted dehydrogenase